MCFCHLGEIKLIICSVSVVRLLATTSLDFSYFSLNYYKSTTTGEQINSRRERQIALLQEWLLITCVYV